MAAGQYNFTIKQGESFSKVITWKDSAGVAINITDYIFKLQSRHRYEDTLPVINLSTVAPLIGIAITSAAGGQITITMAKTVTAALNFTAIDYDLFAESPAPAGLVTPLLEGTITLDKSMVR